MTTDTDIYSRFKEDFFKNISLLPLISETFPNKFFRYLMNFFKAARQVVCIVLILK